MVDVEFTTHEMNIIENCMNDYFNGHKPPKIDKDIIKLLKKINIMRETFEEIDLETREDL